MSVDQRTEAVAAIVSLVDASQPLCGTTPLVCIDGPSGAAFASLTRDGATASVLFSVNLQTGRVTRIGRINNSSPLVGLAVAR